jgi:hypothetical protein
MEPYRSFFEGRFDRLEAQLGAENDTTEHPMRGQHDD